MSFSRQRIFIASLFLLAITGCTNSPEIPSELTSIVYLADVTLGKTGSEVCFDKNMSCIALSTTKIIDEEQKFYGFSTPSCNSPVVKKTICIAGYGTEYAIENVDYEKSPNAESTKTFAAKYFCLGSEEGKKGIYRYAYCVKK